MKKKIPGSVRPIDQHRRWLGAVDAEGPFLAARTLVKAWPHGMPSVPAERRTRLTQATQEFERAWDAWDKEPRTRLESYRSARDEFVDVVLREVIGWGEGLSTSGSGPGFVEVSSPRGEITVKPTGVVRNGNRVGALVLAVDPGASLSAPSADGWSQSPIDRMEFLLRKADTRVGVVTDGQHWAIVSVPAEGKGMPSSGEVDALAWSAEAGTRDAFVELLSTRALFNDKVATYLPDVFEKSQVAAEEITDALGAQVRKAVELLVAALDESSRRAVTAGDDDPLPEAGDIIYEAVVTVVMRVVFLLFAEERGLLPQSELYRRAYGLVGQLDELERQQLDEQGGDDSLDRSFLVWHRLLATSTALYGGANFEDLRLPAYGGSLFDPARFPFLAARTERGTLALGVSDLVMLHVLRAVQEAEIKGEGRRRVSFRDIDVEQIGYIYEGLLGYTCRRADSTTLGLLGPDGAEPEMPLDVLDELYERAGSDAGTVTAIAAWVKKNQPAAKTPTTNQMTKALAAGDSADDADPALRKVTGDEELRERLRGWLGIIRRDLRGRPMVVAEGGWMVVETPSRKNAGAHYTPKALAAEVVLHALEPLVFSPGSYQTPNRDEWEPLSSDALLELKVADIACGSGAFLVAAARYLADRLVEAWQREGRVGDEAPEHLKVRALRAVVAQCLYGADINGMAVEMCKLSLWLVSLDPGKPFSFVDDKVFHGNSLLGLTSLRQLEELHVDPKPAPAHEQTQMQFRGNALEERLDLRQKIDKAAQLRRRLAEEIVENDPQRSAAAKSRQMEQLHELTRDLQKIADGVIAAGLPLGGKPGKKLDEAYENLRVAVGKAYPRPGEVADASMLEVIVDVGLTPTAATDYARWEPLHWCLAVPEVIQRGGFDAIIGNPPFLEGLDIKNSLGDNYRGWITHRLLAGRKGLVDMVAYFFIQAFQLARPGATLGLIATDTLAQGDTREVALRRLWASGFTCMRAIRSQPWPARNAGVNFAAVWGGKGPIASSATRLVDGGRAPSISPLLEPDGRTSGEALVLNENRGLSFVGCYLNGKGFEVSDDVATSFVKEPMNRRVVRRYLTGAMLGDSPGVESTAWAIDFADMTLNEAKQYRAPLAHVERFVKPGRENNSRKSIRERWWRYAEHRPGMRKATEGLDRVIVIRQSSQVQQPAFVKADQIIDQTITIFTSASLSLFATLASAPHQLWLLQRGLSLGKAPRYTPSDVFETFPRPQSASDLLQVGTKLDEERREIMVLRELGLTQLYNLVNDPNVADEDDPDVARMRAIHTELDHVVMQAYGWGDVELNHGFHTYRQMTRWTVCPEARVEILDRLLEENHRRAALQGDVPAGSVEETAESEGSDD